MIKEGSNEKVLDFTEDVTSIEGASANQVTVEKLLPLQSFEPGEVYTEDDGDGSEPGSKGQHVGQLYGILIVSMAVLGQRGIVSDVWQDGNRRSRLDRGHCWPVRCPPSSARRNGFSGGIVGLVANSSGIPQMGATVLLFDRLDRVVSRAFTDEAGGFLFDAFRPGSTLCGSAWPVSFRL